MELQRASRDVRRKEGRVWGYMRCVTKDGRWSDGGAGLRLLQGGEGPLPAVQLWDFTGTSLVVQQVRLLTSTTGDITVSIHGWGTKIPRAAQAAVQLFTLLPPRAPGSRSHWTEQAPSVCWGP